MKRKTQTLLALLLWGLTAWAQGDEGLSGAQLTEKGLNAERLGLMELAENYYRRALTAGADGAAALRLGVLLEQKEYYEEATALLVQGSDAESQAHAAQCLVQRNMLDSALHCAERAIEQDTSSALAMTVMAYVESHRDHHINAIAWANRALKARAGYARGENMMGYVQYRKGNDAEAMRRFKQAVKLDSTLAEAYYNLGTLYCLRNSPMSAIKLLKEGIRRNPRNIRLYTALAQAYRQSGDAPKAMECYNQILEYDSVHTPTINRIGTLYCSQGHYERAIAFHRRTLGIRPGDATAYK